MNKSNNQIRKEEFEKRKIYKGSQSFCQVGYDCPVFMNCLLEINQLKKQLEEKDKVIDEILNDDWYKDECPIELEDFTEKDEQEFKCEHCHDDYKKCWLKYFESKILERGKNG